LLEKSELGFGFSFADGHTEKQMIPRLKYQDKTIVLLIVNGTYSVSICWVMIQTFTHYT
jgi:hypothetical protein